MPATRGPDAKQLMLADLERSGLGPKDAARLRMRVATPAESPKRTAYKIPYFDEHGDQTDFYRLRVLAEPERKGFHALTDEDADAKPLRYLQPPNTINELYLPPLADKPWADILVGDSPLFFTEGEKKSAAATQAGFYTIGLGGVWCFMSKRVDDELLPMFRDINFDERPVYICFDSDAATNPDIVAAEAQFARRLVARGARVFIVRMPKIAGQPKTGMDDYLCKFGAEKFKRNVVNEERCYEFEHSRVLHDLNKSVLYVRNPGYVYDLGRNQELSPANFVAHAYANVSFIAQARNQAGDLVQKKKPAAGEWIQWEHRAEVERATFAPGLPIITPDNELNRWRGWGVKHAKKGSVAPWTKLLDRLFAGAEPAARQWFERWAAYPIQHPGVKMFSSVLFWGVIHGSGKTLVGDTLKSLYGTHGVELKDSDLEDQRFEWAVDKQFVLADDITGQNNRKLSNRFKTMITQKELRINIKYIPSFTVPDRINYYFTSNDPNAFFLEDSDRRFFIHEVVQDTLPSNERHTYLEWRSSPDGLSALFYHLLHLDLGDFDPAAPALRTDAKEEMTVISKSELGAWVHKLKDNPTGTLNGKLRGDLLTADELAFAFDPSGAHRVSANAMARELRRSGFTRPDRGRAIQLGGGKTARLYAVQNVDVWSAAGNAKAAEHYNKHRSMIKEKEDADAKDAGRAGGRRLEKSARAEQPAGPKRGVRQGR